MITLYELNSLRPSSSSPASGRPKPGLTNSKWQQEFLLLKLQITPYPTEKRKLTGRYSEEKSKQNQEGTVEYKGTTNWQRYCWYINDVLRAIRGGNVDFCYFRYQIIELLRFHYDTLRTKYHTDGYWSVWLDMGGEE